MEDRKVCIGVVGAGAISDIYLKNMIYRFDGLSVKSICAGHIESAQKKAREYGIKAVTMEEMLDDPEIRLIVNLTPAHAHYSVIRAEVLSATMAYITLQLWSVFWGLWRGWGALWDIPTRLMRTGCRERRCTDRLWIRPMKARSA